MATPKVKSFALAFPDGSVCYHEHIEGADSEAVFAQVKSALGDFEAHPIDRNAFPSDRAFRDAWIISGGKISHDISRAKEIHKERIRIARKPLLDALDVEMLRALGEGKPTKEIETKKQKLRDATSAPGISAAKSVEELKAVWPLGE